MRKRYELADPTSCLSKAADDEWLFVLRGKDAAAAATVRFWIAERLRLACDRPGDPKIVEAQAWADTVDAERLEASIKRITGARALSETVAEYSNALARWGAKAPETDAVRRINAAKDPEFAAYADALDLLHGLANQSQ